MSSTIEFEGTSEQEAVEKACAALKLSRGDLDYTVIDEGSGGVFGLGARPVQIKVRVPRSDDAPAAAPAAPAAAPAAAVMPAPEKAAPAAEADVSSSDGDDDDDDRGSKRSSGRVGPAPEKAAQAVEVAQGLMEKMGLASTVSVRDEHEQIVVVIEEAEGSQDVAEVLGKSRPPAIPSFQFLMNKIVNRFPDDRKHIVVEVPSVPRRERKPAGPKKQERSSPQRPVAELDPDLDPTLVELARMLADRASSLGKVLTVHPMLSADRRAVHQTITTIAGVQTVSEGDGLYRKMHVVPDSLMGGGGGRKRRRRRRRRRDGDSPETKGEQEEGGDDDSGEEHVAESSAELQETGI